MDDVICNKAYKKLLTQEFNPKIEDFEECDGSSDAEGNVKCGPIELDRLYFLYFAF